ncbi:Fc.00g112330.m01.CDS01 [Cosmosporella sp. VM-42]
MNGLAQHQPPPYTASRERQREEWEEWEDDDVVTPIDAGEQILIAAPPPPTTSSRPKSSVPRSSRVSAVKVKRLKSRARNKTQNAKQGIKLITDMSAFRRQNHLAQQLRTPDGRPVKFVDAAALRALEGEPNSASVGNWNWLNKGRTQSPATMSPQQPARSPDQQLSPEDRPIVIGISLPSDEYGDREMSPPTATATDLQTPLGFHPTLRIPPNASTQPYNPAPTPTVQRSVWSPDTPDTVCSFSPGRATSSIYSQVLPFGAAPAGDVPPVPALPANYKKTPHQRLISLDLGNKEDDDDSGTPCTLFEEDGAISPEKLAVKGKAAALTPDSAGSKSHGWWDHVVTPFMDKRLTFTTRKPRLESPQEEPEDEWWSNPVPKPMTPQYLTPNPSQGPFQAPIVRAPTPRRSPSPRSETTCVPESGPSTARSSRTLETHETSPVREKPQIIVTPVIPSEQSPAPPPYSPPKKQQGAAPVRYRAVFPPGHPLQAEFPPSPGPVSPGLSATMTSQGAREMTEIPITPATIQTRSPLSQIALPNRPIGTFLPHEHSHDTAGEMTRTERERRRHEKEDVVARRVGGLWRGRGCIPEKGCFGRSGREGRKRRRVWIGILSVVLLLLILCIVLAVVLTRPHHTKDIPSIWVNLTDYPPMPTGVLTVVGPDNTVARDGCTEPSTLWSCSLPKDQHDSVAPYKPDQPTVIMNIQWDNGTQDAWKVPNGDPPTPVSRRSAGSAAQAGSVIRERQISNETFTPDPSPPDFQEMFFLGDTTDNITSEDKGGEPTPFYISLLDSIDVVDSKDLDKRQDVNVSIPDVLPSPDLNQDGTAKPAVMIPDPVQQPVRLYDRGLPTEHYGFYTYFKRTIYLKSVTVLNDTSDGDDIPLDKDGGCKETEANFLTTWSETRLLVRIWTRTLESNTSTLLTSSGQPTINGNEKLIRPGTMPYPVTVTLDTHGGNPAKKFVWDWPIDDRQQLDADHPKLLANNIGFAGTWINRRSRGDKKFGGFDGGSGGSEDNAAWLGVFGLQYLLALALLALDELCGLA